MSRFEERVEALINDRVNDLERLFLTSESDRGSPIDDDCCQEVLRKVNDIDEKSDEILKELRDKVQEDTNKPEPTGDDPERTKEFIRRFKEWLLNNHPETFPDVLTLPGPGTDSNLPAETDPWGELFRFLWDVLDGGITGEPADLLGMILRWLPYIGPWAKTIELILTGIDLYRKRNHPEDIDWQHLMEVLLSKVNGVEQRLDSLAPVIAGLTVPGSGDQSVILDRLQSILDDANALLIAAADLDRAIDVNFTRQNDNLRDQFGLVRADYVVMRSEVACVKMWLAGNRNCDEFQEDLLTVAISIRTSVSNIQCDMHTFYGELVMALNNCCSQMSAKLTTLQEGCEELTRSLTGPGNPVDHIDEAVQQGNVVGTGSLVLNYSNDLNVIKSMLIDIRRLL